MIYLKIGRARLNRVNQPNSGSGVAKDAERFRARARECLAIAMRVPDGLWRTELIALATDLNEEADEIEREERPGQAARPEPSRE